MDAISNFAARYARSREEEMSIDEYLAECKRDPMAYATAAQRMLAAIGEPRRLFRHRRHLVHGAHELVRRGGDLLGGGADLRRRGGDLVGGRLLLLRGGGDFGDRGVDLDARLLDLADEAHHLAGHAVETAEVQSSRNVGKMCDYIAENFLHEIDSVDIASQIVERHMTRTVPARMRS